MSSIGRMFVVEESILRLTIHVITSLTRFCDIFNRDERSAGKIVDFSNEDQVVHEAVESGASSGLRGSHVKQHCPLFSLVRFSALCMCNHALFL